MGDDSKGAGGVDIIVATTRPVLKSQKTCISKRGHYSNEDREVFEVWQQEGVYIFGARNWMLSLVE
jgi:hypothetical protein